MSDERILFQEFLGTLSSLYRRLATDRDEIAAERHRLFVIAAKHCPTDHHDWQEILKISGEAGREQGRDDGKN